MLANIGVCGISDILTVKQIYSKILVHIHVLDVITW